MLGCSEGETVGIRDDIAVGRVLGTRVTGDSVGVTDGEEDKPKLGGIEGTKVGPKLGAAEGD